jgi:hypothetical protein
MKMNKLGLWNYLLIMSLVLLGLFIGLVYFAIQGKIWAVAGVSIIGTLLIGCFFLGIFIAASNFINAKNQIQTRDNLTYDVKQMNDISRAMLTQNRLLEKQLNQKQLQAGNEPDFGNISLFEEGIFNELESGEQGE